MGEFKLSRFEIELPSGNVVECRRLAPVDAVACGLTPDLAAEVDASSGEAGAPEAAQRLRGVLERIACRGATRPRFCLDEKDARPGEVIWVGELPFDDLDALTVGISRGSGMTTEAKKDVLPLSGTRG